jgi:membrane fusion protein, multidrug efflux system
VFRPVDVSKPEGKAMTQASLTLTPDTAAPSGLPLAPVNLAAPDRARQDSVADVKRRKPSLAKRLRLRVPVWTMAIGGALIAAAAYIYVPSLYVVETDDASFQADTVAVMPKVAAYVSALHVTDNSSFAAGQLLVELDPRDYQAGVNIAAANLQSAQAAETVVESRLAEQSKVIAADEANLGGDRGTLIFASQQLARFAQLARDGAGTIEQAQQAQSNITERKAVLQRDTAALAAAQGQSEVLRSQVEEARANVVRAQAALDQAKLNLSYTKIYAPCAGTVANRSVQKGDFVQPGQTLFSAVPNQIYVIANFKETQLTHMHADQPVTIHVDAFPNHTLHGHIDSFQRGTGSNFALLPPENATGNFVKIVQRVPVKILVDDFDGIPTGMIGPGMSVEATVTIHTPPRWLAWLL